jgi:ubiquinone/menaquinone biosynthesis C-methylase UbiE
MDFDSHIGFWIENIPYVWVPGIELSQSKRFYIFQKDTISAFDSQNNLVSVTDDLRGDLKGDLREDLKGDLCIIPLALIGDCNLVRNCFLVSNEKYENKLPEGSYEIRIQGKIINLDDYNDRCKNDCYKGIIKIVDSYTNYFKVWRPYPLEFSKFQIKDITCIITLSTQRNSRTFNSLYDAAKAMKITSYQNFKRVHLEAMLSVKRDLNNKLFSKFKLDESAAKLIENKLVIIDQIIKDIGGNNLNNLNNINNFGWKYNSETPFLVAHTLYEILINEKKIYSIGNGNTPINTGNTGILLKNTNITLTPKEAGIVVYTKHSLKVAQKISKITNLRNIDDILNNFYGKKSDIPLWTTNKAPNKSQFVKFISEIHNNSTIKDFAYIDIGSGNGEDTKCLSSLLNCKNPIYADIADVTDKDIENKSFIKIVNFEPFPLKDESMDAVSMLHSLHHMPDAEFRLRDITRFLKSGGFILLKDHNVVSDEDAKNVSFEHFVYSVGEGKAELKDKNDYQKIEPMYYFSADIVSNFLESLGYKRIFILPFNNPTKTYQALFQKK